jgi:uncharacterized protein (DUF488 family)
MAIFTIGHSTHPIERFVCLLEESSVTAVADVRRYPGSRRNPQFGAEQLAASLDAAGIGYESLADSLGGRRSESANATAGIDLARDNSAWRSASFRAYADYMGAPAFAEGIERLEHLAAAGRVAVMCAEAHPSRCHRQLIADALLARGWEVTHILDDGRRLAHELSGHAVVIDGEVQYPGESTAPLGSAAPRSPD